MAWEQFDGTLAADASSDARPRRVEDLPLSEIQRRPRLAMRDPQQPGARHAFDLEDLNPPPAPEPVEVQDDGSRLTAEDLFREARERAEELLDEARRTAETMVEQARMSRDAELEAARTEGRQAGYEEGYAAGLEDADRESAGLIAAAEDIALHVARERDALLESGEGEIVELAIAIAERIVNASIEVDPDLVVEVCRGAMRKAFQRETLTVLAHPSDLQVLRNAGPQLAAELGGVQHLEFVEERRLQRGSVIVRTPAGEIDATFRGKSEKIAEGLRELVATRRAERRERER